MLALHNQGSVIKSLFRTFLRRFVVLDGVIMIKTLAATSRDGLSSRGKPVTLLKKSYQNEIALVGRPEVGQ